MKDWKKWLKWIIPFLIIAVLLIILWPKSKALEGVPNQLTITGVEDYKDIGMIKAKHGTKNVFVYCIEGGRGNINSGNIMLLDKNSSYTNTEGVVDDNGVRYIALHGFQGDSSKTMTEADKQNYYITQLGLWLYYYEIETDKSGNNPKISSLAIDINKSGYVAPSGYEKLIDEAKDLCAKALEARKSGLVVNNLSYDITDNDTTLKATSDENYIESELVTVTTTGVDTYTASVDDSKFSIVDINGNVKTTFKTGDKIKLRTSKSQITEDTEVTLKLQINFKELVPYQFYPEDNPVICQNPVNMAGCMDESDVGKVWFYRQSIMYVPETVDSIMEQTITFNYQVPVAEVKEYKVKISKQDATTSKELPGAKLKLVDSQGNVVDEWTSTQTPHEVVLTPGDYSLTETIAPDGYVRNEETVTFTVNEDGTTDPGEVVMLNKFIEVPATALNNPMILFASYILFALLGLTFIYIANKKQTSI